MEYKTKVILKNDTRQSKLKKGDKGYVDGYVQAADSCVYAIFVRLSDGLMDLTPVYNLNAVVRKPVTVKGKRNRALNPMDIIDLYNEMFSGTNASQTRATTPSLISKINEFTYKHFNNLEKWTTFFNSIKRSEFLMGRIEPKNGFRKFKLKLAWIINDANLAKIINGDYHEQ